MRTIGLSVTLVAMSGVVVTGAVVGCAGSRLGDDLVDRGEGRAARAEGWPFAAAEIRVHPLTRVRLDGGGAPELTLHLDVRDQWGDATKSVGVLQVVLSRVGPGGMGDAELRWALDLSDLEVNSAFYDPSTRTYRVRLGELPADLGQLAVSVAGGNPPVAVLTVTLQTHGPNGETRSLRDEMELTRG